MPVYVIRAGTLDLYKVGVAGDPHRRLAELQTGSPFHLTLVAVIDGGREVERRVHAALHAQRARGEWFELPTVPTPEEVTAWAAHEPSPRQVDPVPFDTGDPVGLVEIADRLGVQRNTADAWRKRGLLPPARWTVGGRPAWNWDDIEAWARESGRLS